MVRTITKAATLSSSFLVIELALAQSLPANPVASQNTDFAQRYFARKIGTMQPVAQVATPGASTSAMGQLIVDAKTRNSNEVIVRLNHDNPDRLALLVPGLAKNAATPAVERAFQRAVLARSKEVDYASGGPIHVRYMIAIDRMSDEDRAAAAVLSPEAKAAGFSYDPRERLDRYMVLRYGSVELAQLAQTRMQKDGAFSFVGNNSGGAVMSSPPPNDAYFSYPSSGNAAHYQWGLHQMGFPAAWDKTRGQSYVGVFDAGWPGTATTLTPPPYSSINLKISINIHNDLKSNFRNQMIMPEVIGSGYTSAGYGASNPTLYNAEYHKHTVHVSGIIAAQHNNGQVAGGCPECSIVTYPYGLGTYGGTLEAMAAFMRAAVDSGMQVVNWSGGTTDTWDCINGAPVCDALAFATLRSVLVVQAAGNNNNVLSTNPTEPFPVQFLGGPHFPANLWANYSILPVGGSAFSGQRWTNGVGISGREQGSNWSSSGGVIGPAKSIVSTFSAGQVYGSSLSQCGDASGYDESYLRFPGSGLGDGVGSCTGTSMAAPHISALAGLVWSVKPRATANDVRTIIRNSGNNAANNQISPNAEIGYGLPNANSAVTAALASNPTRLTPLFSYYSYWRSDSLYTTVPHMARSAAMGMLRPRVRINDATDYVESRYTAAYGTGVTGYSLPGAAASWGGDTSTYVKAQVWVFTTDLNPKNAAVPLRALYRMSWKCNDPSNVGQPYTCTVKPRHMDTVLVDKDELPYFEWLGYQVDGIEGFVYPKTQAQPLGTVRLMRKYNADQDDHAIFPETAYSSMYSQGWMYDTNYNDWLGYVYPNTGPMPTVQ